jgi:hypothetical protein
MTSLDDWLQHAARCDQLRQCRADDTNIDTELAKLNDWAVRDGLATDCQGLGSYAGLVGPTYRFARRRILYVAVNPGRYSHKKWPRQRERLERYAANEKAERIFEWEANVVWPEGRNSKWRALFLAAGLNDWKELAFTNIVLCPTRRNTPPNQVVRQRCTESHLIPLVDLLKPHIVIYMSMKNQEHVFDSARGALTTRGLSNATIDHPSRRGEGQNAEHVFRQVQAALRPL